MKRKHSTIFLTAIAVFVAASWLQSCSKPATQEDTAVIDSTESSENSLSQAEKDAGWQLLFDGSSLDGWKRYGHDTIGPLWTAKEGMIVVDGTGLSGDVGGSLMTTSQYGNFELTVDWKLTQAGGNSGILYHVVEKPEFKTDYASGPEAQIIDDAGWKGDPLKPAQTVGSNYDMFEAAATKKVNPVGEWNTTKIVYNNGHVEHWLNGEKVVEFEESSPEFTERYKKSKWVDFPGWNESKVGAISLQDHGAPVHFRNIKIRAL